MPVVSKNASREDLEARRDQLLEQLGMTMAELRDRHAAGLLTADEWEAWEQLDGLAYLLDD